MADFADWLPRLCMLRTRPPQFAWAFEPFYLADGSGHFWTVATNGLMLVAVAGRIDGFAPGQPAVPPKVLALLGPVREWHETIPTTLLRQWSGPAEYRRPCDCARGGK
jgi:hypothetical protein